MPSPWPELTQSGALYSAARWTLCVAVLLASIGLPCPHKAEGRLSNQDLNPEKSTGWICTLLSGVQGKLPKLHSLWGSALLDRLKHRFFTHSRPFT